MRRRPASRLLVLDPDNRLLLFRFVHSDGAMAGRTHWATPGGGVEPGESFEEAAIRELREEVGLDIEHPGAQVARRLFPLTLPDGEVVEADERFFIVRAKSCAVQEDKRTALEQRVIAEHRWWTVEALRATEETVWPEGIADLVSPRMHPPFQLRPGTPQDATTIAALAIQVFLDTYATEGIRPDLAREALRDLSPEAFLERLNRPGHRFLLAEIGVGLVGFAEVDIEAPPCPGTTSDGAELVRLYVQPAFQRAGIGSLLLKAAEEAATSTSLWLTAWEGNRRARDFYAARGYVDIGETVHVIEGQRYVNRVLRRAI